MCYYLKTITQLSHAYVNYSTPPLWICKSAQNASLISNSCIFHNPSTFPMEDDELSFITSKISVSFSKWLVLKISSCRKWSAVISTLTGSALLAFLKLLVLSVWSYHWLHVYKMRLLNANKSRLSGHKKLKLQDFCACPVKPWNDMFVCM